MSRRYRMLLKINGEWECVNTILADDHPAALRKAIGLIDPAHYDKPLRIEEDVSPIVRAEPRPPRDAGQGGGGST